MSALQRVVFASRRSRAGGPAHSKSKPGATLLSSCQSSCGSVTGPSFFPAAGPQGRCAEDPRQRSDRTREETTHTGGREASLALPPAKSELSHLARRHASPLTSRRGPCRGTRVEQSGGHDVRAAARRKGGRSRVTTDHGEFASGLTSSLPRRLASLT